MTTRPASARRRRALPGWVMAGLAAVALWCAGLVWFAEQIPTAVPDPNSETDAVVVLTGGAGRLSVGTRLLVDKKARKLFISGVHRGVDVAQILRMLRLQGRQLDCCMVLGFDADDTRGNARETAAWMKKERFHSLRLVTASYHMRRSLLEFRRAMPDVAVIPHPVFPQNFKARSWWNWPGTAQLLVTEYVKYLVALMRPW